MSSRENGLTLTVPHWRARFWSALAMFALLVMESTTTALWYQAVFAPEGPPWIVIFATLFCILTVSMLLPRGLDRLHARRAVYARVAKQAVVVVWILLAGYTSLKVLIYPTAELSLSELLQLPLLFILQSNAQAAGFFHLLGVTPFIWRGVSLARGPLSLMGVQASFQLGLFSMLLYGLFYAPMHATEATIGLYLYLFCGLTAMSLSRIANLSETRGGRVPRFGLGWLASIVLAGLAVVGLAVLAGWISSGQIAGWVVRAFIILLGLLTALMLLVLSPLFLWMARLIPLLADLLNQILERLRGMQALQQASLLLEQINDGLAKLAGVISAGRGLLLAGILLAVVMGVMLALYLRRMQRELVEEEASERSEIDPSGLSLQTLLQRMLNNAAGFRLRRPAQLLAAARIRQIYRQLMLLSQKMGEARPPSVTPLEFLPRLNDLFPDEQSGLERITGAYISVRYGDYPESSAEVDEIQAAWERVRKQGRRMLAVKKRGEK